MHFHIITLFPKAFSSYLGESILKRAIEDKKIKVSFYNPRDFTKDKRKRIDRTPYAGGPGMVIQAEPIIKAIEAALKRTTNNRQLTTKSNTKIIFLSPSGKQFTNQYAEKIAKKHKHVLIICGRYEGIDARVKKVFKTDEISVGPFVLTGGELPATMIIDVVSRQIAGVLGNFDSLEERRISTSEVYTRPEVFKYKGKSYRVPKILLSGNTREIERWKKSRKS
ncbi:MAG: tRNA (guanosine(37)-N1)-methyltransferase TrmD [Candidatus Zambryskibacteria bacterium CG11_big_fil_rev_8_21_14_0_20_42_18]|uniref:tRNA (guanine-N(1)-)-methyltransferase n=2 Tax=Parcubacteria group TaxID=1794811 RepID=A0A2H0RJ21_9BACT|nr:MAG: tRNA (guanosine(37)-N1)-methyltransferase TrmD [Candidatus Zambryskibacteria bacterium CG11_big_fil_rev_8_21_14_0_20_42_18]PIR46488.1 MAG: tRNA (guanosine(37)-N1)-methyltransferase TrmD [Candidatus Vogelbacteria bacterium CG10_big_fil_rev_8_21_14_0_10_45_14]PJA32949.1 MAG: tRNA (guanosine(37)-N1)-methyltransferase TrmD [Candidatus Zambryskibacteria bacterium CG_4_9_14_3_um_filter_42_15]